MVKITLHLKYLNKFYSFLRRHKMQRQCLLTHFIISDFQIFCLFYFINHKITLKCRDNSWFGLKNQKITQSKGMNFKRTTKDRQWWFNCNLIYNNIFNTEQISIFLEHVESVVSLTRRTQSSIVFLKTYFR